MLNSIKNIQEKWLTKTTNKLDVQDLPFPDSIKAAISQADKQDQKRECLILMAQMQALLAKPIPHELRPQLDTLPVLEGCTFLVDEMSKSEELTRLTNIVHNDEFLKYSSPFWGCLAEHKIIMTPRTFLYYLIKGRDSSVYNEYASKIKIYAPWTAWFNKTKNHEAHIMKIKNEDLANGLWDKQRFIDKFLKWYIHYDFIGSINQIFAHENEQAHKNLINALISHVPYRTGRKIYQCLKRQQENHPSESTRLYIEKYFEENNETQAHLDEYVENAVDCFKLEGKRLFNKYHDCIAPPKIANYFHRVNIFGLWQRVAQAFDLTMVQFFDYWDIASFSAESNEVFYIESNLPYNEIPQEVIERKYIETSQVITDNLTTENFQLSGFYDLLNYFAEHISDEAKNKISYDFIFDKNFYNNLDNKHAVLSAILNVSNQFVKRLSLNEMLFCLNNFVVNYYGKTVTKKYGYQYDKNESTPDADYLFLSISKETAQAYLDHLLESGITEQTSERDYKILSSLRLNILLNSK